MDRGADPPHRVGREAEAFVGIEFLDGLHQADIAFGNHFTDRQAVAAIAHRDLGDEAEVRGDELVRGLRVAVFLPALRQHELVFLAQHRKLTDLREIPLQSLLRGQCERQRC